VFVSIRHECKFEKKIREKSKKMIKTRKYKKDIYTVNIVYMYWSDLTVDCQNHLLYFNYELLLCKYVNSVYCITCRSSCTYCTYCTYCCDVIIYYRSLLTSMWCVRYCSWMAAVVGIRWCSSSAGVLLRVQSTLADVPVVPGPCWGSSRFHRRAPSQWKFVGDLKPLRCWWRRSTLAEIQQCSSVLRI